MITVYQSIQIRFFVNEDSVMKFHFWQCGCRSGASSFPSSIAPHTTCMKDKCQMIAKFVLADSWKRCKICKLFTNRLFLVVAPAFVFNDRNNFMLNLTDHILVVDKDR